jgi:hypothetical protein
MGDMTSAEPRDDEPRLHMFSVDDPRIWEFRSRLSDEEFALSEVSEPEWEAFHAALAER